MMGYLDVILKRQPVGARVAIVGAGGIGFDVAEFLVHDASHPSLAVDVAEEDARAHRRTTAATYGS